MVTFYKEQCKAISELLDGTAHNNGHRLNVTIGWDRYVDTTEGTTMEYVWETLPAHRQIITEVVMDRHLQVFQRAPSLGHMQI